MKKYKWLGWCIFCLAIAVVSSVLGVATQGEPYTAIFSIPIIASLLCAAYFLMNYHAAIFSADSFRHKKKKIKSKMKDFQPLRVNSDAFFYYLNRKYFGGEEVAIRHNHKIFFVGRQRVRKYVWKGKICEIYLLDQKRYDSFDELINDPRVMGVPLSALETIEIVAIEGKEPKELTQKRDFSRVKPHPFLWVSMVYSIVFGLCGIACAIACSDWLEACIFWIAGLSLLTYAVIAMLVFTGKVRKESRI